jgi:hypothetical protein
LEYLVIEGKIILKWILKKKYGMNGIDLDQDEENYHVIMNAVINYQV